MESVATPDRLLQPWTLAATYYHVQVVGRAAVTSDEPITCGIPGHDHPGQKWTADVMSVDEAGRQWEVRGKCGFSTDLPTDQPWLDTRRPAIATTTTEESDELECLRKLFRVLQLRDGLPVRVSQSADRG